MFQKIKTGLLLLCSLTLLNACASHDRLIEKIDTIKPTYPPEVFVCSAFPPPSDAALKSQAAVAAWLETEVYLAWQDCSAKLVAAGKMVQR